MTLEPQSHDAPSGLTEHQDIARNIRLLVLDVDGVMTDGRLYLNTEGQELKAFNTLDGHGIKMLQKSGVKVGIITGRNNPLVAKRAKDLGIEMLYQGREDKLDALAEMLATLAIEMDQIAYLGDDLPDLPVIRRVGLGVAVPNAHYFVRQHAKAITERRGGEGAVRELCDFIMASQGSLDEALRAYL